LIDATRTLDVGGHNRCEMTLYACRRRQSTLSSPKAAGPVRP